ncbi:hypothetical protein BROOK1789C_1894 [Bathymodiolus brooksi thiotrophic gill symbiont]|nr:hypothetical protein BROOK1789C_1894 [Bathymodiolus brooksi thiotrophic gill symbiont]
MLLGNFLADSWVESMTILPKKNTTLAKFIQSFQWKIAILL